MVFIYRFHYISAILVTMLGLIRFYPVQGGGRTGSAPFHPQQFMHLPPPANLSTVVQIVVKETALCVKFMNSVCVYMNV